MMRSRITQLGAAVAINLTAGFTDVLILDGGEGDPRMGKVRERSTESAARQRFFTWRNAEGESQRESEKLWGDFTKMNQRVALALEGDASAHRLRHSYPFRVQDDSGTWG